MRFSFTFTQKKNQRQNKKPIYQTKNNSLNQMAGKLFNKHAENCAMRAIHKCDLRFASKWTENRTHFDWMKQYTTYRKQFIFTRSNNAEVTLNVNEEKNRKVIGALAPLVI